MCGRIYCGDYPEYSKYEQKTFWEFGNGLFPDVELNALFEQTGSFGLVMHFVLLHLAIFDFFNFIFLFFITGNQLVTYKVVAES